MTEEVASGVEGAEEAEGAEDLVVAEDKNGERLIGLQRRRYCSHPWG